MVLAIIENWPLSALLWVYWAQSVTIGLLWFFKILNLKEFSTKDFRINDRSVKPTHKTKVSTARFFLFHYGFFHVGYFVFIKSRDDSFDFWPMFLGITFLVASQCFSFFYNRKWLTSGKPNIGSMMFFPYLRVVPMHLTIIIGSALAEKFSGSVGKFAPLVLFMLLKTLADAAMHMVEARGFADRPKKVTEAEPECYEPSAEGQ
jgi:hypothetical protein